MKLKPNSLCMAVVALFGLAFLSPLEVQSEEIDEIRAQALMHAMLVRSIAYSYGIENTTGWKMKGEFWGEGTRFRVNRTDIEGMMVGDKRIAPLINASAYDDARYQLLTPDQKRLRIQDGNSEANYSVGTPQTYLYLWLQESGKPFRWDSALNHAVWDRKFAEATYTGKVEEEGLELETIEIPQREQVKTPCIFKISFAPALGYLPIKYTRRVEQNNALSTTMFVEKYKTVDVDGKALGIPIQMRYTESGADGVSLKQSLQLTVDEDSLKINEPIDQSLFVLSTEDSNWVYDVDRENRILASVEMPGDPVPAKPVPVSWMLALNLSLLALVALAFIGYRLRSGLK
jgi:hypothetical protein